MEPDSNVMIRSDYCERNKRYKNNHEDSWENGKKRLMNEMMMVLNLHQVIKGCAMEWMGKEKKNERVEIWENWAIIKALLHVPWIPFSSIHSRHYPINFTTSSLFKFAEQKFVKYLNIKKKQIFSKAAKNRARKEARRDHQEEDKCYANCERNAR